ncbi:MAG: hypothetical protein WAT36_03460 [Chromatiaceae bacterium]
MRLRLTAALGVEPAMFMAQIKGDAEAGKHGAPVPVEVVKTGAPGPYLLSSAGTPGTSPMQLA